MALRRFFVDSVAAAGDAGHAGNGGMHAVSLSADDFHHMVHVVRIGVGERVELVVRDSWLVFEATVTAISDAIEPSVTVVDLSQVPARGLTFDLELYFGIAKGDTSETVVRMATELGVSAIVPFMSSRSVVRLDEKRASARGERFRAIAAAAVKQSHRGGMVRVDAPVPFASVPAMVAEADLVFVAWEESSENTLSTGVVSAGSILRNVSATRRPRVAVVIGPEGGLSAGEVAALAAAGGLTVTLGPTILRVDTAAAAALAVAAESVATVLGANAEEGV